MINDDRDIARGRLRQAIRVRTRMDEHRAVEALIASGSFDPEARARVARMARTLVNEIRRRRRAVGGVESFLHEYGLSNREGVALMCLAEALLRIPDADTADALIQEKIGGVKWQSHLGRSDSLLVNASTWGLILTGGIVRLGAGGRDIFSLLGRAVSRSGEPVIREAVRAAMRILGGQFVMGRTIEEALETAEDDPKARYSFDMLGEAAMTAADAARYFDRYADATRAVGKSWRGDLVLDAPSISVKLSALHPRFEFARRPGVVADVAAAVMRLAQLARGQGIGLTVDAEEAARLEPTLDVFERVFADAALAGWDGFGIAVQAYQKRAPAVIDWLASLAQNAGRRIPVRLVKGAYWDTEIKLAQEAGLDGYPVYTRKAATDLSYLVCARRMFASGDALVPQFATHNAHTVSAVIELAREAKCVKGSFEFQRLHGMGEALYGFMAEAPARAAAGGHPVRVYAPVGSHEDLLPYLVRRLLENGANTSFVNRIGDDEAPIARLVGDPAERMRDRLSSGKGAAHPRIPLPADLFGAERKNSKGVDLNDPRALTALKGPVESAVEQDHAACPVVRGRNTGSGRARRVYSPSDLGRCVGTVRDAGAADVEAALAAAADAARGWSDTRAEERAEALERAARSFEDDHAALMALAMLEGGKTVRDAVAEVREAVDLLRYYAARARADFAAPRALPGVTGEDNTLALAGRGVFACISPWNFPLAIFTGQVAAALAAGNAVIAKPAEQTPLIAARAVRHLHEAGVPGDVLAFLPGTGEGVGARIVRDGRVNGVAFTGSTETAQAINRSLAARDGPIARLIAETGGQNAMIVDSSALPEQVVRDVVTSAFLSTGQRCSALRTLLIQEDVADRMLAMLAGATAELRVGDPAMIDTDVGPVIDADALAMLEDYAAAMARKHHVIARVPLPEGLSKGHWFPPVAIEIGLDALPPREIFGPVLHVVRYRAEDLDCVLDAVAAIGYGLTLGIHSRLESTWTRVRKRLRVGNTYVNRSMIGAVVGSQPFGGEGLSGTGPKAGGPHYLVGFALERTLSVNITAMGGNPALLAALDAGEDD
jgi:RHH-type proline utilization regulon transcriptional repressor/proline dehydrogenase/delta 1-pyrroline-5-carboxylate dehydrogenase